MKKLIVYFSTALILISLLFLRSFSNVSTILAATIAEQTQEYSTPLQVWQVYQELGSNLEGPAGSFTFRIMTDVSYTQQFDFTAQNTRIFDKDNGGSSIAGCVTAGTPSNDPLRGLQLNTGTAPTGYMNISIDFSCRNYTFIPGHRYLIKISNANRYNIIHFATATTITSPTDHFPAGGLRYTYANPYEPICNPLTYIYNSTVSNNGCIVFTSPKDDLYFTLSDPSGPTIPSPSATPTPTPSPSTPTSKTPLIFIPGIGGSELKVSEDTIWSQDNGHGGTYNHAYAKDEKVWVNIDEAKKIGNDDYFDILKFDYNGVNSLANLEPTGEVFESYTETTDYLISNGYEKNKNFFIFTYDWRKDLNTTTQDLDIFINKIIDKTNNDKVDIVTHSMGGLISRQYINVPNKSQKINKLINIAPPYLGSPLSLKSLLYGHCLTDARIENLPICIGLTESEIKDVFQNLPSAFQLLPSLKYYTFYDGSKTNLPLPFKDDINKTDNTISGSNYFELKKYLADTGFNTHLLSNAELFHSLDESLSNTQNVDISIIVGSGKPTLGQIIEKYKFNFGGIKIPTKDMVIINGDNTVPLFSASLNDPSRSLSLFNPTNVFYSNQTHSGITKDNTVLSFVKNILDGTRNLTPSISKTPYQLNGTMYSVHSPVLIHAYDEHGNHTGPTENGFETNIPESTYEILDDAKFIFLPTEGNFTFKFEATDNGSFDFKIKDYRQDKLTELKIYKDIPLTQTTTAEFTPFVSEILNLDLNGDGLITLEYSPTEISGTDILDQTAPNTEIELTGTEGQINWYRSDVTVSLSPNDATGSGIAKTEYSINNGELVQLYNKPFNITESTKLQVKSTDNIGNEEEIQEIEIKIDKTPPEVKIILNPNTLNFDFVGQDESSETMTTDSGNKVTITDESGNTLDLVLKSKERPRKEKIEILSLEYNKQKYYKPEENLLEYKTKLDKNKKLLSLDQRIVIKGEERIKSIYQSNTNITTITRKLKNEKKEVQEYQGKTFLFLITNIGILNISH